MHKYCAQSNGVARWTSDSEVAGSSPARTVFE